MKRDQHALEALVVVVYRRNAADLHANDAFIPVVEGTIRLRPRGADRFARVTRNQLKSKMKSPD